MKDDMPKPSLRPVVLGAISLDAMAGGLEKNIVLLANHLAGRGHHVSLITFDQPGARAFYTLEPAVRWHQVGRTPPHGSISFKERLALILRIRDVLVSLGQPIVVCFHHGILPRFFLAAWRKGLPIVCSERNSLSLYQHIKQRKQSLGFMMLSLSEAITVQFSDYVQDYPWWLRQRIRVMANPVQPANCLATPALPAADGHFKLLAVGRLCAQKNQKALISAFAQICHRHTLWDLHLLGDGESREALASQIQSLGLEGRVFLRGKQHDIPGWLTSAHLFCMPSKWEGFPNALAEAMAHGLPCIGLANCRGVSDLIVDGECGKLVPDTQLAHALDEMMTSPDIRNRMGIAAVQRVAQYHPDKMLQRWDAFLAEIDSGQ